MKHGDHLQGKAVRVMREGRQDPDELREMRPRRVPRRLLRPPLELGLSGDGENETDGGTVRTATLNRMQSDDQGTTGTLTLDDGTTFFTMELPWRDNHSGLSCVPLGTYQVAWAFSPAHGKNTYRLQNVQGRTAVEIHAGNFGGDVTKGLRSDILGCILLGEEQGVIGGQKAVLESKAALFQFEDNLDSQPFQLTITGCVG